MRKNFLANLGVVCCCLIATFANELNAMQDQAATEASPQVVRPQTDKTMPQSVIVVQGAGGSKKYQAIFRETCLKIEKAAKSSKSEFEWIGREDSASPEQTDLAQLKKAIEQRLEGSSQLWIIFIGHGTFDRKKAKFNLRGPDLVATDLHEWLLNSKRPVAIVNCASASAPFINALAEKGRVIVTATKSGFELNYTRFGIHFADALTNLQADIDKDDQVSLLEAFLFAAKRVEEFYQSESRLATEHALLDDNADGKGTPRDFFRGVRVAKKSADGALPDGPIANQIHLIQSEFEKLISAANKSKRNALELKLELLRARKKSISEEEYFTEFEKIVTQLAELYKAIESQRSDASPSKQDSKPTEQKPLDEISAKPKPLPKKKEK